MRDAPPRTGLTAALRGPFGLLWAGQTVSLLGDGVFLVAFTWQLAVQWRQPALLGLLLGARVLAEVATLGLGGLVVDRVRRRTVVLAADAGRALLLFALAGALHRPAPVALLAALLGAYGALTALFRAALAAYIPQLVPCDRLPAANALYGISLRAAMVVGPAVGALLIGAGSTGVALQANGASFLAAAAATLPLPARPPAAAGGKGLAAAAAGFRAARRVGWVGGTILVISLTNLGTIGAERLALPAVAAQRYAGLGGYAAIVAAIATGGTLVAWVAGRARQPPRDPGRRTYAAALAFTMATLGLAVGQGAVAAVGLGLVFGAGQQLAELEWTSGLQRFAPDRLLGRVMAAAQFGQFLFLPLSFAVGGLVVGAVGPRLVLAAAGANGMLLATVGLLVPALHRWRPLADAAAAGRQELAMSLPGGQPR